MTPDSLAGLLAMGLGVIGGWWVRGQMSWTTTERPAIALSLLPPIELRDVTPALRAQLDEAVAALRLADERVSAVSQQIWSETSAFAIGQYGRARQSEAERTLSEARRDITHAIGSLADRSNMTPEAVERVAKRYE